jgi:hypothetical protein
MNNTDEQGSDISSVVIPDVALAPSYHFDGGIHQQAFVPIEYEI